MALRTIPIRRVGHRPNLFMGGDRKLVMFTGLLAFTLIFTALELRAALFGLCLWFGVLFSSRLMAKSDPLLLIVFWRHYHYKKYYPPRSTPFRRNPESQGKQYR